MQQIRDTVVIEGVSDTDPALTIKAYAKGGSGDLLRLIDEAGPVLGGLNNVGVPYGSMAGGAAPNPATLQKARYYGGNVSVPASANTPLKVDNQQDGADLLDMTNPLVPKFKITGVYAVMIGFQPGVNLTAGISVQVQALVAQATTGGPSFSAVTAQASTALPRPTMMIQITYFFAAGDDITFNAYHADSAARNIRVDPLVIQKLV